MRTSVRSSAPGLNAACPPAGRVRRSCKPSIPGALHDSVIAPIELLALTIARQLATDARRRDRDQPIEPPRLVRGAVFPPVSVRAVSRTIHMADRREVVLVAGFRPVGDADRGDSATDRRRGYLQPRPRIAG